MRHRTSTTAWTLAALLALSPTLAWAQGAPPAGTASARDGARTLAARGMKLYEAGEHGAAARLFADADALYPAPQYRVYAARAHARGGKLCQAAAVYESAVSMPLPNGAPTSFEDARRTARDELAELKKRIPALHLDITGAPAADVKATVDGVAVAPADWARVAVDAGQHVINITAPAAQGASQTVDLKEGAVALVTLVLVPTALPPATPTPAPVAPVAPAPPPAPTPLAPAPAPAPPVRDVAPPRPRATLSHRRQFGVIARADVDPLHTGERTAAGLTFGVLDRLELGVSALIGRTMGVEPQATAFVLEGAWKPLVNVGAPIFFAGGPRAGVRGAVGLQWDPVRRFGVFVQVGGAYFPAAGAGYEKAVLLPSAGVQGRI